MRKSLNPKSTWREPKPKADYKQTAAVEARRTRSPVCDESQILDH